MISRIVSGGQTGADRGGLDAAIYAGIPHGGWCPLGRLAEDGTIPSKYNLREMSSRDYLKRTEANVVDSDVTVIFCYGQPAGGSRRTVMFCEQYNKPCHCVDLSIYDESAAIGYVTAWLTELDEMRAERDLDERSNLTVNIAGSRESKAPGLQEKVMRIVVNILHDVNRCGPIMYPVGDEGLIMPKSSLRRKSE